MRATVIVDDNSVIVDGIGHRIDCTPLRKQGIRAVQWFGGGGEIEFFDYHGKRDPNKKIYDTSCFQDVIDKWQEIHDLPQSNTSLEDERLKAAKQLKERIELFQSDPDRSTLIDNLKDATPEQIKKYINKEVTDLASAKAMITKLTLVIAMIMRN